MPVNDATRLLVTSKGEGDAVVRADLKKFVDAIQPEYDCFLVVMRRDAKGEWGAESFVINDFTEEHAALVESVIDDYLPDEEHLDKPQG